MTRLNLLSKCGDFRNFFLEIWQFCCCILFTKILCMSCTGLFSVAKWRKFANKKPSLCQEVPHQSKKLDYPKNQKLERSPLKTRSQKTPHWETNHSKGNGKDDGTGENILFPYCRLSLVSFWDSSPISCILFLPLPQSFGGCCEPWLAGANSLFLVLVLPVLAVPICNPHNPLGRRFYPQLPELFPHPSFWKIIRYMLLP